MITVWFHIMISDWNQIPPAIQNQPQGRKGEWSGVHLARGAKGGHSHNICHLNQTPTPTFLPLEGKSFGTFSEFRCRSGRFMICLWIFKKISEKIVFQYIFWKSYESYGVLFHTVFYCMVRSADRSFCITVWINRIDPKAY